ncbi:MAG: type II secretion system protein, partial [Candidatus Paceibacterota bacterium]
MKILRNKNKEERGFTIIETVISIGIFVVIFVALIGLFHSVMNVIRNNKAMLAANNIIVEELEIVRGMDYDFVKTDHGFSPPGQLASEKSEVRSGTSFAIITDITFVDDPFDGVTPADTFNKDYKKVRITVKWKNPITNSEQISTASTNVVPEGREGLDAGFGGMFITVFDLKGDPVS